MATPTTSAVYINVIEDVISKVREEFIQYGAGDTLAELQALWEMKLMHSGTICCSIERSPLTKPSAVGGATAIAPVHDLNVPYEGTEEYVTPTADMVFPPTPLQTPVQTPLPGTTEQSVYQLPTPSEYPTANDTGSAIDLKPGRPSPYMQPPPSWMNQRPLSVDVNVAFVEGRDELERGGHNQHMAQEFFTMSSGKRKREDFAPHFGTSGYIPQQDGAGDATFDIVQLKAFESHGNKCPASDSCSRNGQVSEKLEVLSDMRASLRIPQQDGPIADTCEDLYPYHGVANEDYNLVSTPASHDMQAGTLAAGVLTVPGDGDNDDDEPPLNENDDDDDFDDVDEGEEPKTDDLVLAQFEKVTRTKNRWKCTLKGGIMRINDKDILFNKATGEFDF